ncbi:sensor histidine kinase [Ekhidna sp. To15]|uniref:sensor histidine kinase n=1 Tax=Ekhidna sp. To15 TaxID=3395267 RepID=UPI003F5263FB
MLPEPVKVVFVQYAIQGLLALVIMLILRKFFRQYRNNFFDYWSWSWLALFVNMIGSCVALANAFLLPLDHPVRLLVSFVTVIASFLQILWLYAGTREISRTKKINRNHLRIITILIIPISVFLVAMNFDDPVAGEYRIFYRVGIRSMVAGVLFIICSKMLWAIAKTGIGIRFILLSFIAYGLLQLNYFFVVLSPITPVNYFGEVPYYMGAIDIFLQALMGLGMIISVLEIEQHNLKKANTELDTFLYRSSHDLRSPLTTISGIVSAIRVSDDEKKINEFLTAIDARVLQADNVIRDIITLRKGQKADLAITEIDLENEIKAEFSTLIDPNIIQPKLTVEVNGEKVLNTDQARLHTVLTNILGNAIRYHDGKPNAEIIVKISQEENGLNLQISDNGAGIDEKHLPRIFDMFYRANKSSNGTGLGLYLVKDALGHMEGTIDVFSQKGKGTTFYIYLPDLKRNQ